jgi:CBS domain-containing protein
MVQKVRDLMTTQLAKLEADRSVAEGARLMREQNVGDVLVVRDGKLAGIVTDRDIVVRCVAADADPKATPLASICSQEMATLAPEDDADMAVVLMERKAIRRIPVVERGKLLGIVSLGDLAADRDRMSALGQISTAPPNR